MTTQPNQYTLSENGITYGLHTFKDGVNPTVICQLHPSGEWITLAPATERQVTHFAAHGIKAIPVVVAVVDKKAGKALPNQIAEAE
jgi:hypothetical protein